LCGKSQLAAYKEEPELPASHNSPITIARDGGHIYAQEHLEAGPKFLSSLIGVCDSCGLPPVASPEKAITTGRFSMMRNKGELQHVHIQCKSINAMLCSGADIGSPISLGVRISLS
jgi:hypothetical protein